MRIGIGQERERQMDLKDFTADGIQARLQRKRDAERAKERAQHDAAAAHHLALREAFEKRELPPDALHRVMMMAERAIENGQKEALVYRFPSDFMSDSGRSITSRIGDWRQHLTGSARRAHEFFRSELEPRGFSLRAGIVEYKDGIPGDVGFYLSWARPET
jgi:hypothetical protein